MLEENVGVNPCDLGLTSDFLAMIPKTQETKQNRYIVLYHN
jgi:hypothetical protein